MSEKNAAEIRDAVRRNYGAVAERGGKSGCAPSASGDRVAGGCCVPETAVAQDSADRLGYSPEEQAAAPEGADLGLGCGNPQAIAALQPGETVVDLGSGAGFDCFLAAAQVGPQGRVIGVDMTPEMIEKARANAQKGDYAHVEFRQGEIERPPVDDASVDVIISNCVINLSPDKAAVFREAHRVLRPGGRLAVSDIVASAPLPERVQSDLNLYVGCVAGAETVDKLEGWLRDAGFAEIRIRPKDESREFIREWAPEARIEDYVLSATIEAVKPG
jgi:SAM-dependent methyltransferase